MSGRLWRWQHASLWLLCLSILIFVPLTVVMGVSVAMSPAQAQNRSAMQANFEWLVQQINEQIRKGDFSNAIATTEKALTLAKRLYGEEHKNVAALMGNLAYFYHMEGRLEDSENLYQQALAIEEKLLGPDDPAVGTSANNLAALYAEQHRYPEAEALYRRSLAIRERHAGPDDPGVGQVAGNLAKLVQTLGRDAEAEQLFKRALANIEAGSGSGHPDVATTLNNLALLYKSTGRMTEAERSLKRALAIYEQTYGGEHRFVAVALNNLGDLYWEQGRVSEADPLYLRALAICRKVLPPNHPQLASSLERLASIYHRSRNPEAETLYKQALAIKEKVYGSNHAEVADTLNHLANVYQGRGRFDEAEPLYRRSLNIREQAYGSDHWAVAQSLNNLAYLRMQTGRFAEAEPLYERSLAIEEKIIGPEGASIGMQLNNLADMHFRQQKWREAAQYWERNTALIVSRTRRSTATIGGELTGKVDSEAVRDSYQFEGLIRARYRLAGASEEARRTFTAATFVDAQWSQGSAAAASIAQMAARTAKGDDELARLVRRRQDLAAEWQGKDNARLAALAQPPSARDRVADRVLSDRLTAIDEEIGAIDAKLRERFPEYAALAAPEPLTITQAQSLLQPQEALVLILDTARIDPIPEESFVWVVTRTDARWVRTALGSKALSERVAALRSGLDGHSRRFDLAVAHELYTALFGEVADLIADKQLLLVPSGPLTSLPFQVLVKEKPAKALPDDLAAGYGAVDWLARRHALTVLPSIASLAALRRQQSHASAAEPYLGFGNPLLLGAAGNDRRAWSFQSCSNQPRLASVDIRAKTRQHRITAFFRDGRTDVAAVQRLPPLPETASELCEVARLLGVGNDAVLLGRAATERTIKTMSANGRLARARILHFATHGLVAGEFSDLAEPALVLTPPDAGATPAALAEDDGLLTASEIAKLNLNAEWVVLSACNTASEDGANGGALSGFARAFFYAGARALLVSHWPVDSVAAVQLTTGAIGELTQDPRIGRAEALRRAMLRMINGGGPQSHPTYWAPFVVVGEG